MVCYCPGETSPGVRDGCGAAPCPDRKICARRWRPACAPLIHGSFFAVSLVSETEGAAVRHAASCVSKTYAFRCVGGGVGRGPHPPARLT